jgi:hypothetical protein
MEATARLGMELGYHVTLIKDATAAFSHEGMHAAHEVMDRCLHTKKEQISTIAEYDPFDEIFDAFDEYFNRCYFYNYILILLS